MSTPIFDPDDPRLTAYALGELPDAEREAVESLLAASPAARVAVEETRALSGRLETEFAQENAAYQRANPPTPVAANVIPFPRPARRWMPATVQGLKIAAVFLVLAGLASLLMRRQNPAPTVAMAPPPAPRAVPEAPAPPADEKMPAASTVGSAAATKETQDSVMKPEAPPPDVTNDRIAQASVRRAQAAEAAPGAARRALPAAAAPMGRPAPSVDERLAAATVRVRLDDGTYVGGVLLTADGLVLAARKLAAIRNPGHVTVLLADGREFASAAAMQSTGPGLFRIKGTALPTVALATQVPVGGSQLVVAHIDSRTGEATFQHTAASQVDDHAALGRDVSGADFVFDAAGKLLDLEEAPALAKSSDARARTVAGRAEAQPLFVRPYTARERASLTQPLK